MSAERADHTTRSGTLNGTEGGDQGELDKRAQTGRLNTDDKGTSQPAKTRTTRPGVDKAEASIPNVYPW